MSPAQSVAVTREAVARAIHEGLGDSWAYANYSGNEWVSCRDMLDRAADNVLALPQIAADSPYVTTRLAEAADRAAKAEARAEKAEARCRSEDIATLTCERDAAIAQRDRAVAEIREYVPHWEFAPADIPVPDRLAAEREAGRREGRAEALEIAERCWNDCHQWDPECRHAAGAVRALRETPK